MGSSKVIHALYTDDDVLLAAVKTVKNEKHHIEEIFTPFPVHGLDKAMGLEPTRIAIAAFMYGCVGLIVATLMMNYIMIEDLYYNSQYPCPYIHHSLKPHHLLMILQPW